MDISAACAVLEQGFADKIIPPEIQERLVRMVRCQDPGGLPTPFGPNVACPHCRRPFSLTADPVKLPSLQTNRMACVTLLYGNKYVYFLGALVLGQNLEKFSQKEKILLYTADVPIAYLDILRLYWDCRLVKTLSAHRSLFQHGSRFHEVFTKLQCLALYDYAKVLMLDNDMLIRESIDHLFQLRAPAAMRRHGGRPLEHGETYKAEDLWRYSYQNNGMNAGVVLLEPNEEVYKRMTEEIRSWDVEHCATTGPEQDYWSRFYTTFLHGGITHIHCQYNYQVGLQEDYVSEAYKELKNESVYVVHYSGIRCKPWELPIHDLLFNDDAIHLRFPVEDGTPYRLSKDVVGYIWEWIMDLRLVANVLQAKYQKTLQQIVECVGQQLAARKEDADIGDDDRTALIDALGPWALSTKRQRWALDNDLKWLEFRPSGILWTEDGNIGFWTRAENNMEIKLQCLGEVTLCLGEDKTFTGPCQGWPFEISREPSSDGWLSHDDKENNHNSSNEWTIMDYEMSGASRSNIKKDFCRAITVVHGPVSIGIGVELQGQARKDGKGSLSPSYHLGRIEYKDNKSCFYPWRGDIDAQYLDQVRGSSDYYGARVTPRSENVPTRWFFCTREHGCEYKVVSSGKTKGDGNALKDIKSSIQLSDAFVKAMAVRFPLGKQ